ncbi:MAG: flippase-like domain-containing protein [Acidobacteria bacterium]|nr:flippase-like domain-containing protein [Acidobacteriota bacterium]
MIISLLLVLSVIVVFVLLICRRVKLGSMLLGRLLNKNLKNAFSGRIAYLSQLEDYVFDFFSTRPKDFFLLIASHAVFHFAGILEIYATLKLIGFDISPTNAFILESVNRTINIMFTFVPALIGVDEAGSGLVAASLGIGATAGVSLAIIRKIRMFFWIALGLIFLLTRNDSESKS